jgi:hypothetical protein
MANMRLLLRKVKEYASRISPIELLVIIPAFVLYMLAVVPSGTYFCFESRCGLYFWGAHEHDANWHIALAQVAFKTIPFNVPIYAGEALRGYNFLLDIVMYGLWQVGLPPLIAYFKLFPLLWFIFFAISLRVLANTIAKCVGWTRVTLLRACVYFFVFFGSSLGFLLTFRDGKGIDGALSRLTMQGPLNMTNLQFVFSVLCYAWAMTLIIRESLERTFQGRTAGILALLLFLVAGLKFYGLVALFPWYAFYFILLLKMRKFRIVPVFVVACLLAGLLAGVIFYDLLGSPSRAGIVFAPLKTVYPIVEDPNLFYNAFLTRGRYYLEQTGSFGAQYMRIILQTYLIFIVANLGTRLVFMMFFAGYLLRQLARKRACSRYVFVLPAASSALVTTLFGTFFVQKGEWWNTIQFFYFTTITASIFAGLGMYVFFQKLCRYRGMVRAALMTLGIILISTTFLPNLDTITTFAIPSRATYIPDQELRALKRLREEPFGVVLAPGQIIRDERLLPQKRSSAYISAYSGHIEYVADSSQYGLLMIDSKKRHDRVRQRDCTVFNDINYFYVAQSELLTAWELACDFGKAGLQRIYHSDGISVYRAHQKK